jgi:WD40 repeat protein
LWDAQTGARLRLLQIDRRPLYDVAFNADGTRLATAGWTGSVNVWDMTADEPILALRPEGGPPARKLDFKVPGSKLLTIHYDKTACLWDTTDGRLLASYVGSEGEILSARMSDDVTQVVTAGVDGKVRMWDAQTGPSPQCSKTAWFCGTWPRRSNGIPSTCSRWISAPRTSARTARASWWPVRIA